MQQQISFEKISSQIDSTVEVLVDYFDESMGEYVGHSQYLSPMVDFGIRFVDNGKVKPRDIVKVKIFDFDGTDVIGECL